MNFVGLSFIVWRNVGIGVELSAFQQEMCCIERILDSFTRLDVELSGQV
jgi:hypothetical protein